MINFYLILLVQLLINLLFIKKFSKISKLINIYDIPGERKNHKMPVATLGGFIFFLNYIYIFFIGNYFHPKLFPTNIVFITFTSLIFIVGFVDDKINLKVKLKFPLFISIILIHLFLENKFLINNLDINFLALEFNFNIFQSYFFTLLCILLFMNASNLYDGINLQFGIYIIVFISYLIYKDPTANYLKLLILPLIFFIYLNYLNKCFFGDSGTLFISYFLSFIIINQNQNLNILSVSEIFLLMIIPGLDMLRLFFKRLLRGKNPFHGDRDHLHHYMIRKFDLVKTNMILISFTLVPLLFFNIFSDYLIFILFLPIFFYIFAFLSIRKLLLNDEKK